MTSPAGDRRERLVALLVAGVAVVLLLSSPTWFASDRAVVGGAQVFLGIVLAGVAAFLYRRAQRR
jgi:F0F1-type ATP synthase assembly protein I